MDIRIDRESAVPVYLQIRGGIRELILSGRLPDGFRLPPERQLATALGVNRTTVLSAYRELKADGLLEAHVGRGTEVVSQRIGKSAVEPAGPLPWRQLARDGSVREPDPLVRDVLALTERHDVISLQAGLPAAELLPLEDLRRVQEEILVRKGPEALLHSPTEGVTAFREALCRHMVPRGIRSSPEEVLVTSGSQQGLDLVARTLLSPGDLVVVEEPSYFGALEVFRSARVRLLGVPTDADGMRTDVLEALLARQQPRLIYTLPTFQNPSGCVLSPARRRHLLELAWRHQVPILEDDPYSDLRYEGEALPSLKALDPYGHVIHLSSFSKVLFPGLRLGWIAAPRPLVRQLALVKQTVDLHSGTLGQWIVRGSSRGTLRKAPRGDPRGLPAAARRSPRGPRGGRARRLHLEQARGRLLRLVSPPRRRPSSRLLAQAATERVAYLPGGASFVEEPPVNSIRLNFTFAPEEQLREGVRRLGRALRAAQAEPRRGNHTLVGTPPIV
ncbi:MAG: PLP-dependent aminotransferase family protein [Holophagales bacterium]|nr:PLP-dependent aminotransferase family protein [Holophagales bacterium]